VVLGGVEAGQHAPPPADDLLGRHGFDLAAEQ
jgi:hypothetical protein